jgi:hypothetical protein
MSDNADPSGSSHVTGPAEVLVGSELPTCLSDADFVHSVQEHAECLERCLIDYDTRFYMAHSDDDSLRAHYERELTLMGDALTLMGESWKNLIQQWEGLLGCDFVRLDELALRYLHSRPGGWSEAFVTELTVPPDGHRGVRYTPPPESYRKMLVSRIDGLRTLGRLIRNDDRGRRATRAAAPPAGRAAGEQGAVPAPHSEAVVKGVAPKDEPPAPAQGPDAPELPQPPARGAAQAGAGDDPTAYRPMKEFLDPERFPDYGSIRRALTAHPWIRTRRPSPKARRRFIHAGDWQSMLNQQTATDPLDVPAETVDAAVKEVERREAEARAARK